LGQIDWESGSSLGLPDQATISFGPLLFATDGSKFVSIPVRVMAPGLHAESQVELEAWGGWTTGFLGYLDRLDLDWRGWSETREWTDDQHNITLSAQHHSTLLATITATIERPPQRSDGSGGWAIRVAVPYEPASMSRLTEWVRGQLAKAPW
jgi:hypothetical protein